MVDTKSILGVLEAVNVSSRSIRLEHSLEFHDAARSCSKLKVESTLEHLSYSHNGCVRVSAFQMTSFSIGGQSVTVHDLLDLEGMGHCFLHSSFPYCGGKTIVDFQ